MEDLPRHSPRHLSRLAAAALYFLASGLPASASEGGEVELIGTWHVLVHYTDDNTHNPEAWRWDDRVWVFENKGSKLRWSKFPIVVFQDQTGRFSSIGTNRASRVIHAWEPNEGQLAQIREGLEVNPRGKKSKSLRGSDEKGWASSRRRSSPGASVITYVEDWSIDGMPEMPVFQRADMMGSMMTENMEGLIRYAATEVSADGRVISGTFERDGTRHGRFRMSRSGEASDVKGSGKTQGERLMNAWFGEFASALRGDRKAMEAAIQKQIDAGEGKNLPPEARDAIRAEIRADIEKAIEARGLDPRDYGRQIETLTRKVDKALVEDGKSADEIGRMIEEGEFGL